MASSKSNLLFGMIFWLTVTIGYSPAVKAAGKFVDKDSWIFGDSLAGIVASSSVTDIIRIGDKLGENERLETFKEIYIQAAALGRKSIVNFCIKAGVPVDHSTADGASALMYAAEHGQLGALLEIIDAGADINRRMPNGRTALMYAAEFGHLNAVNALLSNGADAKLRMSDGRSALSLSAEYFHSHVFVSLKNTLPSPSENSLYHWNGAELEYLRSLDESSPKRPPTDNGNKVLKLSVATGHVQGVRGFDYDIDEDVLVTFGEVGDLYVWSPNLSRQLRSLTTTILDVYAIKLIRIPNDGRMALLVAGEKKGGRGATVLVDLDSGNTIQTYEGHEQGVTAIAYSVEHRVLATGDGHATVRLWDLLEGKQIRELNGPTTTIQSVQFLRNGSKVSAIDANGNIVAWKTKDGRVEYFQTWHESRGSALALNTNGNSLVSGGDDYKIVTGDLSTVVTQTIDIVEPNVPEIQRFKLPRELNRGHNKTGEQEIGGVAYTNAVNGLSISPNGISAAVGGGRYGTIHILDLRHNKVARVIAAHKSWTTDVKFVSEDLVVSSSIDGAVKFWDPKSGNIIKEISVQNSAINDFILDEYRSYLFVGYSTGSIEVWSLKSGRRIIHHRISKFAVNTIDYSSKENYILVGTGDGFLHKYNFIEEKVEQSIKVTQLSLNSITIAKDESFVIAAGSGGSLCLVNMNLTKVLKCSDLELVGQVSLSYLPKTESVFIVADLSHGAILWDLNHWNRIIEFDLPSANRTVLVGSERIWMTGLGSKPIVVDVGESEAWLLSSFELRNTSIAVNADESIVYAANLYDGLFANFSWRGYEVQPIKLPESSRITKLALNANERLLFASTMSGQIHVIQVPSPGENANDDALSGTIYGGNPANWAVVDKDGRFDTGDLHKTELFSWIANDQVRRPLALELFMREYFEPNLLAGLITGEELDSVSTLFSKNLNQPKVEIVEIEQLLEKAQAKVTVKIWGEQNMGQPDQDLRIYDLRLLRDGQLVARKSEKANEVLFTSDAPDQKEAWRKENFVDSGLEPTFHTFLVDLPTSNDKKSVEFSAYAFNSDRVKGTTARSAIRLRKTKKPNKKRAFVVSIGVSAFENPAWDLNYADEDAIVFASQVSNHIRQTKDFDEVIDFHLVSTWKKIGDTRQVVRADSTKANIKSIFDKFAGRAPEGGTDQQGLKQLKKLAKLTPDDTLVVSFSSHGYVDAHGNFFLLPHDTGSGTDRDLSGPLLKRSISSADLATWLSDIDVGELVLIVDSCHSAGAIDTKFFKPAPLGAKGLGQLAYDKGIRVLAASRVDDLAWESKETKRGLLTFALIDEGLAQWRADFRPMNDEVTVREWLRFANDRVPNLFEEVRGKVHDGEVGLTIFDSAKGVPRPFKVDDEAVREAVQRPVFFDYRSDSGATIAVR